MWLVAGLGNPGAKYARNRHNIGFMVVDELVRDANATWKSGKGGDTANATVAGQRVVIVKPMEFMNLSGFAVQRTADFHHIEPKHILVVHVEIDLEHGVVRLKSGGGHGGHNGLRSIIEQLGKPDFARLRMGVGRDPNKPPGSKDAAAWVLADFSSSQTRSLDQMIKAGLEDVEAVVSKGILAAMNQHNNRPACTGS